MTTRKYLRAALFIVFAAGLLAALVPSGGTHMCSHPDSRSKERVQVRITELQHAIENFRVEYGRLPITAALSDDVELRSEGVLVAALMGTLSLVNPRKIRFYQPAIARNGINGLEDASGGASDEPEDLKVVDAFGEMYYVLMDADGDGWLDNPEYQGDSISNGQTRARLKTAIAVYSPGADRDPNTWQDNIKSWDD